jgi:hypothetical protein
VVDENSVVDRNSIKLVDESSVVVENTGLNLEEVDEKTVVYQSVFSRKNLVPLLGVSRRPTSSTNLCLIGLDFANLKNLMNY